MHTWKTYLQCVSEIYVNGVLQSPSGARWQQSGQEPLGQLKWSSRPHRHHENHSEDHWCHASCPFSENLVKDLFTVKSQRQTEDINIPLTQIRPVKKCVRVAEKSYDRASTWACLRFLIPNQEDKNDFRVWKLTLGVGFFQERRGLQMRGMMRSSRLAAVRAVGVFLRASISISRRVSVLVLLSE